MKYTILLFLILILGFFLRAQETLSGNFLFLKDQGRDLLAVKSIVIDRKLTLIGPYTGLRGVFQGPLYYYLIALPFALSHGDPRIVMWLVLLSSMLAIVGSYVLGKRFFSPETGLLVAFLFATSPSAAAAATFLWSPFFIFPLMTFFLYFFFDWLQTFSKTSFIFLTAIVGLMFHFEIAFAAPFTVAFVIISWVVAAKKKQKFPFILFITILGLFLSPLLIFDFRHNHITFLSLLSSFKGGDGGLGGGEPYIKVLRDHLIRFIINLKSTFISEEPAQGIFTFIYIFSAVLYFVKGKSSIVKVFLLLPIALFAVYMLYPFQLWDWYVVGLFPVYLTLGGIFLSWLVRRNRLVAIIIFVTLVSSSLMKIQKLYMYPDYGGTSKLKGKLEAIDYIYKEAKGAQFNVSVFTPVVLTDAYDYLFWWYGQKKYAFVPGNSLSGTVYLLIEPDPSKLWSYQGWLETVIKKGNILETRELRSGFIIQKRQI